MKRLQSVICAVFETGNEVVSVILTETIPLVDDCDFDGGFFLLVNLGILFVGESWR